MSTLTLRELDSDLRRMYKRHKEMYTELEESCNDINELEASIRKRRFHSIVVGDRIIHQTMGRGTVVSICKSYDGLIGVRFDRGGLKELLVTFCAVRIRRLTKKELKKENR